MIVLGAVSSTIEGGSIVFTDVSWDSYSGFALVADFASSGITITMLFVSATWSLTVTLVFFSRFELLASVGTVDSCCYLLVYFFSNRTSAL